jgi:acyl-CoA oxidase
MPSNPSWVKALKPSGPQGSDILKQERSKSNLDVDRLANFMFTKEVLERSQRLLKILEEEGVFDKSQNYFRGRNERIQAALARGKRLRQLSVKYNWSNEDYQVANDLIGEPTPYGLHASMFLASQYRPPPEPPANTVAPGDPTRARHP